SSFGDIGIEAGAERIESAVGGSIAVGGGNGFDGRGDSASGCGSAERAAGAATSFAGSSWTGRLITGGVTSLSSTSSHRACVRAGRLPHNPATSANTAITAATTRLLSPASRIAVAMIQPRSQDEGDLPEIWREATDERSAHHDCLSATLIL